MDDRRDYPETQRTADQLPSEEFCAITAGKIEAHLRNGHWELAAVAFRAAHAEWQEELQARREVLTRTADAWLDRPVSELGIKVRNVNGLENVGCHTIREAIAAVSDERKHIPNFGGEARNEFWRAIEERKIAKRPEYLLGNSSQGQVQSDESKQRLNRLVNHNPPPEVIERRSREQRGSVRGFWNDPDE